MHLKILAYSRNLATQSSQFFNGTLSSYISFEVHWTATGAYISLCDYCRCLCAHAMLMHPASPVNRGVDKRNPYRRFGIGARAPIRADQVIWVAMGMMPGDGEVISELASVTVAPAQNQPEGAMRTLYSPLRLANHRCRTYNAEVRTVLLMRFD